MTEILKALTALVNAFKGLLEVVDKMAGGHIRGHIAFWVIFTLIVLILMRFAIESVSITLEEFHIVIPPWFLPTFLVSLGFALISLILLTAVGLGIGALISAILTIFLGSRIERDTNDILTELQAVVDDGRKLQTNFETKLALEKLYSRVQQLQEKQHKRVANRIVRWFRGRSKEKKERK